MIHRMEGRLAAPPDRVLEVLGSEAFAREAERGREDAASSEYHLLSDDTTLRVFEVRTQEYRRSKLGLLDRSQTVQATTTYRLDRRAGTLGWTYKGQEQVGRVELSGVYRALPDGSGCRLVHEATIEVHIPLLGSQISKFIAREMQQSFEAWTVLIRRQLAQP